MSVVWTPLESNPDVMKTYAESLGLDTNLLQFHDVLSTDDWALDMIPRRVHSVIMVFPIKEASEKRKAEQNQRILKNGQTVSKNLYYMKQTVPNACGTIAILHAIGNLEKDLFNQVVKEGSYLDKFFKDTKTNEMAPTAIATYLENDEAIDALHSEASHQGQSEVPPEEEVVTNHFIAFSMVDGCVYECDGRKEFPINHGTAGDILNTTVDATSDNKLLEAAIAIIQREFMSVDPNELRFTFVALTDAAE